MAAKPLDNGYVYVVWMYVVVCAGLIDFPSLRLDGGDTQCHGVIQQRYENSWLPLCFNSFNSSLPSLLCRELKCGPPVAERSIEPQMLSNSSIMLNVSCPIVESLRNCSVFPVTSADCDGAAFLYCTEPFSLRLSGGNGPCIGRVEVLRDGVWGAVCDDHWDAIDAEVTCRQLGCGSALAAYGESNFGPGPQQIHLDDVRCVGNESFLWDCNSIRNHDCSGKEHAGVLCTGHREVRLSEGPHKCAGRLEVYIDGIWATVCNSHWYKDDSELACAELGCGSLVKQTTLEHTLSTSVTFLCIKATSLWQCKVYSKNNNTCSQAKAVGIVCGGNFSDEAPAVTPSSTPYDLTILPTGSHRNDFTQQYFIIVCTLLVSLLLISVLVFTTIIWRHRSKQKFTQQNPSLTRLNEYRTCRTSTLRATQPPDESLQIPILHTGPVPPSPHTRTREPVAVTIPRVPPAAAMDEEEDYDFSCTPPKPLSTFQDSLQEDVPSGPPLPGTEYCNFEKASVGFRSSSSTSSGEQNWYENYRYQNEDGHDLIPPPQSYDGSSEYDDINSLSSVTIPQ